MVKNPTIRFTFVTAPITCVYLLCTIAHTEGVYSNSNRDLFNLPRSSAVSMSSGALSIDGAPNTNPANLGFCTKYETSLSYSGYFGNSFSTSTLSSTLPVSANNGFGVSINYLLVPGIIDTRSWEVPSDNTVVLPAQMQYKTASEVLVHVAYGHMFLLSKNLAFLAGTAANARRFRAIDWTAYGLGLDGGVAIAAKKQGIRAGLFCKNITTNYTRWSVEYSDVSFPQLSASFGWDKEIPYIYGHLSFGYTSIDFLSNEGINYNAMKYDTLAVPAQIFPGQDPLSFVFAGNFGVEYTIQKRVALRAGTSFKSPIVFDFGAGLFLFKERVCIDFAYLEHNQLGGTYQMGLTFRQ